MNARRAQRTCCGLAALVPVVLFVVVMVTATHLRFPTGSGVPAAAPTLLEPAAAGPRPATAVASTYEVSAPAAKRVAAAPAVAVAGLVTYAYGPDPAQRIDVHPASVATTGPAPAILYLHSGGWTAGTRAGIPDLVAAQTTRGWVVLSADYRLAPANPFPAADQDVDRALRWVKRNAVRLGIDPARIVVAGGSAGGHLAAMAAAAPGRYRDLTLPEELAAVDPTPAGLLALVAPTDLGALAAGSATGRSLVGAFLGCPPPDACDGARLAAAAPASHVSPLAPPALFVFGALDTLVPVRAHATGVVAAWRAAGRRADQLVVAGAGHNLDATVVDQRVIDAFLDRVTHP